MAIFAIVKIYSIMNCVWEKGEIQVFVVSSLTINHFKVSAIIVKKESIFFLFFFNGKFVHACLMLQLTSGALWQN